MVLPKESKVRWSSLFAIRLTKYKIFTYSSSDIRFSPNELATGCFARVSSRKFHAIRN